MRKRKSRSPWTIKYGNFYDTKPTKCWINQLQTLWIVNAFILGSNKFGNLAQRLWDDIRKLVQLFKLHRNSPTPFRNVSRSTYISNTP